MRIPIKIAKEFAEDYNLSHVIIFTHGDKEDNIVTYGKTVENCSQAADFGNKLKKTLGWPPSSFAEPSRVRKLQERIKELETRVSELESFTIL